MDTVKEEPKKDCPKCKREAMYGKIHSGAPRGLAVLGWNWDKNKNWKWGHFCMLCGWDEPLGENDGVC